MLCPRCNLRETEASLCSVCMLKVQMDKPEHTTDDEIVNHHVMQRVKEGCRECGSHSFAYEAGVKEENELKWYVILVDCGACGKAYEEIMEVRVINEPIKHEESE
jgi:DNA-directed RNA polymerase subunit M/transcription elongation factor TFIIS